MNHVDKDRFLENLHQALELPPTAPLAMDTVLASLPTWDSLSLVSVVKMMELEYSALMLADTMSRCIRVRDIFDLATGE